MNARKILSGTMALLLAASLPLGALAQTYDLADGSITVEARADGNQYVSQDGGVQDEIQTTETVIIQDKSTSSTTTNTITITAEEKTNVDGSKEKMTAEVTISNVDIDVSDNSEAAISTGGDGNVTIELDGNNTLQSGDGHAGLEKNNGGNLTIGDKDNNGALTVVGGSAGAGIGGGYCTNGSNITIEGGNVTASGGDASAGIGGGNMGKGSNIKITGGNVTAIGGLWGGAGIGGGPGATGSGITIEGGNVTASGGERAAGIGGGWDQEGTDITISGDAQVKVSGGERASDIGGGEDGNGEITPDTSKLGDNGSISYFAPNADKTTANPEKLLHKTDSGVETHENISIKSKTAPTCTKPGSITYLCSCGDEVTQVIPALNHDLKQVPAKAATCTEAGWAAYETCTRCDYTTRGADIPALNHDIEKHPAKAATCTEKGWAAYETCKRCDYTTRGADIPALNHDIEKHPAKAATCTEKGWAAYETCKRCDYTTHGDDLPIDPDNHALKQYPAKAATCTEKGWYAYEACSRCSYSTYVEEPINSNNHDLEHHDAKAATCTESGWAAYETCKRCNYTTRGADIPALDHSFTDYVSNGDAGYETDGTETAHCDNGCGATDTRTEAGSSLPIYHVTDDSGRALASSRSESGSVLTITVNQANATLSGTTAGLRVLQARGITTVVFVTTSATSTFEISDLLPGTAYTLTHSGTAVGFTLDGKSVLSILK